ncbi:hypothetical protein [Methylovulum psychrotolerans]|uniref:IS6 family transposase n=1 Tax=Methylovulum psychrotolerans TaxID=1704499 RepID=A0A2S5CIS1_9GAMM|nr:hypothetical protein [Methylovulum psychrotolerans]POZ50696.1 IS6 family transposase [Methylovulum psychrotolerans]
MLSEHHDVAAAATAFFSQAMTATAMPTKMAMDNSGANLAGLENSNVLLAPAGRPSLKLI